MKRFRQAVLAAAFSGELTKYWQSENELIDNKGQIEENLPEGWKLKKIGSIITPSKEKVEPMMFPNSIYLGLEHIESSTSKIIGHGIASDVKSTKTVFHAGDVLYGKLRPYLNKVCIPDFDGLCSTDILVFNQNRIINNYYLMQFLSTREVVEYANLKSKGISLPRVSFENLAEIPIVLPPLAEQYKIVRRVGMLFERADAFDQEVVAASRRCERLTHAVLGKAFSGKL
jgi:type I restriction enzyme S subunit